MPKKARCPLGDTIVTAGWQLAALASLYPRGIPIGRVTSVGQDDTDLYKQVQVEPFADFDSLDAVLVLVPETRTSSRERGAEDRADRVRRRDPPGLRRSAVRASLGAEPDVLLVTIVCIALLRGSITGAVAGFAGGLLVDVTTLGTLGTTSLLLTLAGYWAGRYGETTGRGRPYALRRRRGRDRGPRRASAAYVLHFLLGERGLGPRRARAPVLPAPLWRLPWPSRLRVCRAVLVGRRTASSGRGRWSSLSDAPYGEPRAPSPRFLPPDPSVEAPYRLTPGLALRVGILGIVASPSSPCSSSGSGRCRCSRATRYLDAAQNNQLRTIRVEAPRGTILDRNGKVIVGNVAGHRGQALGRRPAAEGALLAMIERLAGVLDVPPGRLAREVDERVVDPLTPITVKTAVHEDQVAYLYEHQSEFPGVQIQQTYLRYYPYESLAAQILGYVGEISPAELERRSRRATCRATRSARPASRRSSTSTSAARRGWPRSGSTRSVARRARSSSRRDARAGNAVRLDDRHRRPARGRAGAAGRASRPRTRTSRTTRTAARIVALDPRDGAVLAMASYPDVQAVRVRRARRPEEDRRS